MHCAKHMYKLAQGKAGELHFPQSAVLLNGSGSAWRLAAREDLKTNILLILE